MNKVTAIILAAGKGVRMKSELPKALCELSGKPMVEFLIDAAKGSGIKDIVVIGGYGIKLLAKRLARYKLKLTEQKKLLGSADAVRQTRHYFKNFKGIIVVLYADTPFIKSETIKNLLRTHINSKAACTLLTTKVSDAKEYGRVLRNKENNVIGIIEHTDIDNQQSAVYGQQDKECEINVGAYCFNSQKLFEGLGQIEINKKKGEFYLTDIVSYFYNKGYAISSYITNDADEAIGINRREDLISAEDILRRRNIAEYVESGVMVKDPATAYIQKGATISKGTVIYPFVVIEKDVVIGKDCKVGPFAHIRNGTVLKDNSEIGNFVEIVRSKIGKNSKAKHHSYLGDTLVGKHVNVGAGTITANYDGRAKNKTRIGDNAFIGSGTTIVAPVKIGRNAVTGAGSVVVKGKDVPANTVVVGVPAKPLKKRKFKILQTGRRL